MMKIRIAQFNVAMSFEQPQQLASILFNVERDPRIVRIADTIRTVSPDVVLLSEFDHQGNPQALISRFQTHYLFAQTDPDSSFKGYPYCYAMPSNTGVAMQQSLTSDATPSLPEDGLGFGVFPGQYNFVLLSRFPILSEQAQSWQRFLWRDLPDNHLPKGYYTANARNALPLSSKNHLHVPILVAGKTISMVYCHPTPPVFDGDEKRNWRRNRDELKMLMAVIEQQPYLLDDDGNRSRVNQQAFVVLGDLNNDAFDGDGCKTTMRELLYHPLLHRDAAVGCLCPRSKGGYFHGFRFKRHGPPRVGKSGFWTHMNGLRLDYVLPSSELTVIDSGVFWPAKKAYGREWLENQHGVQRSDVYSDHRMVWVDILFSVDDA